MRLHHVDTVDKVSARALAANGRKTGAITTEWDISGKCESPIVRELWGRDSGKDGERYVAIGSGSDARAAVCEVTVPCRRCRPCLRKRAALWRARASSEAMAADRTWFGTLTLNPNSHHTMWLRALARATERGLDLDTDADEMFKARCAEIGKEITLMLKRVREKYAGKLRFLAVFEAHASGLPHVHMLIHQVGPEPLRYDDLKRQWRLGFSVWKLCDVSTASYVCKYLTKSSLARVRASLGYGSEALISLPDTLLRQVFNVNISTTPSQRAALYGRAILQRRLKYDGRFTIPNPVGRASRAGDDIQSPGSGEHPPDT